MKLPLNKTLASRKVRRGALESVFPPTDLSCDAVWDLLSLYADRETTGDQTAMVETHVAVCVDCARDLAFMRTAQTTFSALPEIAPPANLRAAILAATIEKAGARRRLSDTIHRLLAPAPARYGFAIAAGLAGLVVAIGIHRGLGPVNGVIESPTLHQQGPQMAGSVPAPAPSSPLASPPFVEGPADITVPNLGDRKLPVPEMANAGRDASTTPATLIRSRQFGQPGNRHGLIAATGSAKTAPGAKPKAATGGIAQSSIGTGEMKLKTPMGEAKPNTSDDGTTTTADMVVTMDPKPMTTIPDPIIYERMKEPEPATPTMTPVLSRFVLTSSSSPDTVGQAATLAELKRSLKARDLDSARAIEQSIKAREIRLPVLRKTF